MKIKKIDSLNLLVVLGLTPLSAFTIFLSVFKNSKMSTFLYALFWASISYSYIPYAEYDKARHFLLYLNVKNMQLFDFFSYVFSISPDFLFYSFLYFGGKSGLSFHQIVFVCTFVTIYLFFDVFQFKLKKIGRTCKVFPLLLVLSILSIYYLDVLSGIRFYLAASFFVYSFLLKEKNLAVLSISFVLIAVATHFSILLMIPLYFLDVFNLKKTLRKVNFKLLLILSIFLSQFATNYFEYIRLIGFNGVFFHKLQSYLGQRSDAVDITAGRVLFNYANILWVYILEIYLLLLSKKKVSYSLDFYLLVMTLFVSNLFMPFPEVFTRYILLVRVFLVFFFIENIKNINIGILMLFTILLFLSMVSQIYVINDALMDVFLQTLDKNILIIKIFVSPYNYEDIN